MIGTVENKEISCAVIYNNKRFRSWTESKISGLFDIFGIRYDYETEFCWWKESNGKRRLSDFVIHLNYNNKYSMLESKGVSTVSENLKHCKDNFRKAIQDSIQIKKAKGNCYLAINSFGSNQSTETKQITQRALAIGIHDRNFFVDDNKIIELCCNKSIDNGAISGVVGVYNHIIKKLEGSSIKTNEIFQIVDWFYMNSHFWNGNGQKISCYPKKELDEIATHYNLTKYDIKYEDILLYNLTKKGSKYKPKDCDNKPIIIDDKKEELIKVDDVLCYDIEWQSVEEIIESKSNIKSINWDLCNIKESDLDDIARDYKFKNMNF